MASKLTNCKSCNNEIASSAKQCMTCGATNKKPFYKRPWVIGVVIFFAIGIIGSSMEDDTSFPNSNDTIQEQQETLKDETNVESGEIAEQEEKVQELEKEPEVIYDDPKNWKWNTVNTNAFANGNFKLGVKATRENTDVDIYLDKYVDGVMVYKAPWNYYGEPIILAGYIYDILEYPQGSDYSKKYYDGNAFFEMSVEALDGTAFSVFVEGSSGTLTYNEYIEVTGFVVGDFTGENAYGGQAKNVLMVGTGVYV